MRLKLLAGPLAFVAVLSIFQMFFPFKAACALATVTWMGLWWILRPISITITAFLPIIINSVFNLIPMPSVIAPYFSEIVILLLGSDLISLTWSKTGLDKRLSLKALSFIGTSLTQQIFVWLTTATVLSIFLPNVVVCSILIPIAVSMLRFIGEADIAKSPLAPPILLAIGWGAGIGGFGSPLGGAANLVAISYIEEMTGKEFMYAKWIETFLPFLALVLLLNFVVLLAMPTQGKTISGTKKYFQEMYVGLGAMSRDEKFSFALFAIATALAFVRPLYAPLFPALKPAYVFFLLGFLTFFVRASDGQPFLNWETAQKEIMWGMMFLFAGGLALGKLMTGTKSVDCLAALVAKLPLTGGVETILAFSLFGACLTEISSHTAAASIAIPVIKSIAVALNLAPLPYVFLSIVSVNCAYTLPLSILAIPVSYGLPPEKMFKYGLILSISTVLLTSIAGWAAINFWPGFGEI